MPRLKSVSRQVVLRGSMGDGATWGHEWERDFVSAFNWTWLPKPGIAFDWLK